MTADCNPILDCSFSGILLSMLQLWEQRHRFVKRSRRYISELRAASRQWFKVIVQAFRATAHPDTVLIASSIGYFTLISLFPLILLSVAIASFWLADPGVVEGEVITQLEFVAPALGNLLGENVERIVQSRGPISGFAVLLLLWSSSNIFLVFTRAMDRIWESDQMRSIWQRRGLAILIAMFISALLLVASTAEGIVVTIVNSMLPDELRTLRPLTTELWTIFVGIILFAILYRLLPHRKLSWRDVLPGAILAGLVWEMVKRAFLFFIDLYLSRSNLVYGSVTTIIVFITWSYISSVIFLYGAHLNVAFAQGQLMINDK
jgi:membrane protein